jgi:hypothetical protein
MSMNRRDRSAQATHRFLLASSFLLAIAGCGPTTDPLLFHQLELAAISFGVTSFLMWLGRRFIGSRVWFVCSHCLKPNGRFDVRDATVTTCVHCGQSTSVHELPAALAREQMRKNVPGAAPGGGQRLSRSVPLALGMALAFQTALFLAGAVARHLITAGIIRVPDFAQFNIWHETTFPILYGLQGMETEPPWWSLSALNWVFVLPFHPVFWAVSKVELYFGEYVGIPLLVGQVMLWAFLIWLGHRRRILRWVLPLLFACVNVGSAIVGYALDWDM